MQGSSHCSKMLKILKGNINMWRLLISNKTSNINTRCLSTAKENAPQPEQISSAYETVFTFPFIKYIAILNRLKIYQLTATSLAVPGCGLMEIFDVLPQGALFSAAYIGFTGTAVLALASVPFRNTIGHLYIRDDNQKVKISSVDFWGKRRDRIVAVDDWFPLLDMAPKVMDAVFLRPQLADGTKYKLFVKYGNVLNAKKIGQVLE